MRILACLLFAVGVCCADMLEVYNTPRPFNGCNGGNKATERACIQRHFPQCLGVFDEIGNDPRALGRSAPAFMPKVRECTANATPRNVSSTQREQEQQLQLWLAEQRKKFEWVQNQQ